MSSRLPRWIRRIASTLMLAATLAFTQQSAMIIVSQAMASTGLSPDPAVTLIGSAHFHGHLSRVVHIHGGNTAVGHKHVPDHDHDDLDKPNAAALFWSVGCTTAVVPVMGPILVSLDFSSITQSLSQRFRDGVEPEGLIRPPSTPSIA